MPQAALLSPHSRSLCTGAVSLEVMFLLLKPSPGTGVGFSESDVLERYCSKPPLHLRQWSLLVWVHLVSNLLANFKSRTKEGKWLLKIMNFSELLSENDHCRLSVSLQAS